MRIYCLAAACGFLIACSQDPPPPRVVTELVITAKLDSSCRLDNKPVACMDVGTLIRGWFPTSKPRVDICMEPESRFELALEIIASLEKAGLTVGDMVCNKPPEPG